MSGSNTETYTMLRSARSDGQGYSVAAIEQSLKDDDRSQPVDQNDEQPMRWKASLGAHLKYQLAPADDTRLYLLRDFPAGYELRVLPRRDKVHAYLYGHPRDPRARYRTPAEFVPHLLWLLSESADRDDCSCQFCIETLGRDAQPMDARAGKPTFSPAMSNPLPPLTPDVSAPPGQSYAAADQAHARPAMPPAASGAPQTTGGTPQAPANVPPMQISPPMANLWGLPVMPSPSSVFRVGELVWYKHTAWRLGVVYAIQAKTATPAPGQEDGNSRFILAPLGHVLLNQQSMVKEAGEMRPFLTFSVPGVSIPELSNQVFTRVDWYAFANQYAADPDPAKRGRRLENLGLEASKMAACYINGSFSTFNRLPAALTGSGANAFRPRYGGVYLGAEMITIGDPVRIVTTPPAEEASGETASSLMIIKEILLNLNGASRPEVQFRGNVYRLCQKPRELAGSEPDDLAPACLEEVAFRNSLAGPAAEVRWAWALAERDGERGEDDVQGRFYATHRLMKVIDPASFAAAVQQRAVSDAQTYLNNRRHACGAASHVGWRPSRGNTLGLAVPTPFTPPAGIVEEQVGGES